MYAALIIYGKFIKMRATECKKFVMQLHNMYSIAFMEASFKGQSFAAF